MSDDLHSLPDRPSAAIESIIQNNSIDNVKVSVEGAVPKGQNYTGVVYRVTVAGEKDGRNVTSSYIVKVASNNESIRADMPLGISYQREAIYYTELFPIYQRMEDEAGIPFEDQFRFAKCHHADNEYLNEFIIFEDLKPRGYVTPDRKYEADYEHARCALRALGKMHALSFAFKKRQPAKFKYFTQNITEILLIKGGLFPNSLKQAYERSINLVKNENYKEMFERLKDNFVDRLLETLTQDEFSVLSHSDCWAANMMFNYKNGTPVEACLIDYQVCRYGSPTIDVMYYIFGNTGRKLREECYEDLLSEYHNALENHLRALSYDIEQVYPWTRFKVDLKKSSLLGMAMGVFISLVALADDEVIPDVSDFLHFGNSPLFTSKDSDSYIERVNGIVEDFIKYGYISR